MARKRSRALETLESRRQLAEHRLSDLRRQMERQLGPWTRKGMWTIPLVAFACGMALAISTGRRRRSKREPSEKD